MGFFGGVGGVLFSFFSIYAISSPHLYCLQVSLCHSLQMFYVEFIWNLILVFGALERLKQLADRFPCTAIDKSFLSSCNSRAVSAVCAGIESFVSTSYIVPGHSVRPVTRVPINSFLLWCLCLPPRAIYRFCTHHWAVIGRQQSLRSKLELNQGQSAPSVWQAVILCQLRSSKDHGAGIALSRHVTLRNLQF